MLLIDFNSVEFIFIQPSPKNCLPDFLIAAKHAFDVLFRTQCFVFLPGLGNLLLFRFWSDIEITETIS